MNLPINKTYLDGLVTFTTVAEQRSFRAAAKILGVTPSAISQAIRALELRVGAPLFFRTTRNVNLSEAGEHLLAHMRPAMELLTAGLNAATGLGSKASGRLRINVPRSALPLLSNRLLPDFFLLYPEVELELIADDDLVNIVEHGFDAGIRLGELVQQDMVAVRLTPPLRFVVVGTPTLFAQHGRPVEPQDLLRYPCIRLRQTAHRTRPWEFVVQGQRMEVDVNGPLIVNDVGMCVSAALRGTGLFQMPLPQAMRHVESGELVTVLDNFGMETAGLSLYYPGHSQCLPKLRAFVDFARDRMRRAFEAADYFP
ncbi:LysR family transcriptional regulator [Janthinobacterium agaricidamnosum]|uniref:Bacterial regulatory helix-turn-helix, lysR family protein n=1 Tax=Janthinobacterium agaricidamnosum NBRC 102515 = DSM 9628 TaxID=1349767 RepID=W0VCD6_9BURK|nr:LysR family transcriptional regulator [Janthinobacterium agaricidamnosum]CDG85330.1 bacterial regulatory helix-turn-helix, lysR family protein [Janthinobacterium agaricidamnosum NBRC 102515 = DSM 9628]